MIVYARGTANQKSNDTEIFNLISIFEDMKSVRVLSGGLGYHGLYSRLLDPVENVFAKVIPRFKYCFFFLKIKNRMRNSHQWVVFWSNLSFSYVCKKRITAIDKFSTQISIYLKWITNLTTMFNSIIISFCFLYMKIHIIFCCLRNVSLVVSI